MSVMADWGYAGKTGPDYWGLMDRTYEACSLGTRQSPVDLSASGVLSNKIIRLEYGEASLRWIESNMGPYLVPTPGCRLWLNDEAYELVDIHLHAPSEHRINDSEYPMEVHIVHQGEHDGRVILGIPVQEGQGPAVMNSFWDTLQMRAESISDGDILGEDWIQKSLGLVPPVAPCYIYEGSLTTPPCTEDVLWVVLDQPIYAPAAVLQAYTEKYAPTNRPLQPLNGREVFKGNVLRS
ncbi:carbonic anhydrase family protein [Candidatus Neomarinimicrobiota bacterium]